MKKVLIAAGALLAGFAGGYAISNHLLSKVIKEKNSKVDKFKNYYIVLNDWMILKNKGIKIEDYFINNNYKTIAIYGMGELGNRLHEELQNSEVKVLYGIDSNPGSAFGEIQIYDIEDQKPEVDAIIVTAVFAFDEIESRLQAVVNCPIISLEDVICNR